MPKKGKFIVLYGINNLGKTTQAKMLVNRLNKNDYNSEYIKYPIYDLEPIGKYLNSYLREGNPHSFTPREFELLHFIDRLKFEPILKNKLNKGINIIAEDYFGTAVAWGLGYGVDPAFLKDLYSHVNIEDLSLLLDGYRFKQSIEKKHRHENDNKLIKIVRQTHLDLAREYSWNVINANLSIENIHNQLWQEVIKIL